jgi:hypothetical protein
MTATLLALHGFASYEKTYSSKWTESTHAELQRWTVIQ